MTPRQYTDRIISRIAETHAETVEWVRNSVATVKL